MRRRNTSHRMSAIEKLDVVVVGAGISGICAAHYIKERVPGCKFAVLERYVTFVRVCVYTCVQPLSRSRL